MSERPTPDPDVTAPSSAEGDRRMDPDVKRVRRPERGRGPAAALGAAIAIGAGIGLVFGTSFGNLALGLACGAGLGTVAGAVLEARRGG